MRKFPVRYLKPVTRVANSAQNVLHDVTQHFELRVHKAMELPADVGVPTLHIKVLLTL